jgi:hypothetical protein
MVRVQQELKYIKIMTMIAATRKVIYSFGSLALAILSGNLFLLLDPTYLPHLVRIAGPLLLVGLAVFFGVRAYIDKTATRKTRSWSVVSLVISAYTIVASLI